MRLFKEVGFLSLTAILGLLAAVLCTDIFGANATGELLKFGGLVASGFLLAAQKLSAAAAGKSEIAEFDATTRDGYAAALSKFRSRFRRRMVIGLLCSAVASTLGIILGEWETKEVLGQLLLSAVGGGALTASAVMVGAQLMAASWPAEFLSAALNIARDDKKRLENLSRYSSGDGFQNPPPA